VTLQLTALKCHVCLLILIKSDLFHALCPSIGQCKCMSQPARIKSWTSHSQRSTTCKRLSGRGGDGIAKSF